MSADLTAGHLPTHSPEVCPWGRSCSVHNLPRIFDEQKAREYHAAQRLTA